MGEMKENDSIIESRFEENRRSGRKEKASDLLFGADSSPGPLPVERGVHFSSISMPGKLMNF